MMARKIRNMRATHDGARAGREAKGNTLARSKGGCHDRFRRSVPVDGLASRAEYRGQGRRQRNGFDDRCDRRRGITEPRARDGYARVSACLRMKAVMEIPVDEDTWIAREVLQSTPMITA